MSLSDLKELVRRTTIANVVAAILLVVAAVYAFYSSDNELIRNLAMIAAGYLFSRLSSGEKSG